jgi:hypothetical protein
VSPSRLFAPVWRFLLLAALGTPAASAGEIVLYDNTAGNLPQDQQWLTYIGVASVSSPADGVTVDTRAFDLLAAGYFNHSLNATPDDWSLKDPAFPSLDPSLGFTLGFELQILDEDHVSSDRAGFSVILLGQDLLGIELGFWEGEIWAQSGPSFTHAEGAPYNTTLERVLYELTIVGTSYFLRADGNQLLTGATRDYSPATPNPDPYGTPNMLFLGDDTGSAGAQFTLGGLTLTPNAAPAPPVWALLLGGIAWLGRASSRHSRR